MANKDVLKISFDAEAGIKELERNLLGSMDQISDEVSDKLEQAFEKAGRNPKLKKQLTGVYQGLFDELTEASGDLNKVNEAIDRFVGKIEYINTVTRKSKVPGIFDNLSIKDVDKILKGYDVVIEKEEKLSKLSSNEYKNDIRTKTTVKSLKTLESAYKTTGEEKEKYEKKVTEFVKNNGIETSAISKEIKEYSSLITLFEKINNTKVDYGSEDAIKKSQALLFVMQKISDLEGGNKLFSNFRKNELKDIENITSSISELTLNGVEGSITSFVNKMMKPIKDEITSLYEGVVKDLLKMSKHQAIADAKTQAKISNAISSGSGNKNIKSGSKVDIGDNGNPTDFVETPDKIDVWTKSAEELTEEFKDVIKYATDVETSLKRINEIWDKYANGKGTLYEGEIEEMFTLMKRLDSLEQNRAIDKSPLNKEQLADFNEILFDEEYEEVFDRIDQLTDKQLKKIEELKAAQKNVFSEGTAGGSGEIDDSKVEELREEIKEVKEDISSLKGRVDTLEDTTAFDALSSQVAGFDEKIKNVDGSIENLVSSFKLLSELSLTDLQKVAIPFFNGINQVYKENNGNKISGYWDELKGEIEGSNVELRELLKLVGLYNSESDSVKLISDGMVNSGGLIGDNHVLIARKNNNNRIEETQSLKRKLDEAYASGINVSRILDVIGTKESDVFLEVQETAKGNILGNIYGQLDEDFVNVEWLEATDEQIKKLISDMIALQKMGINVESNLTNIMYDKEKGFSFIDMDLGITEFENNAELMEDHIIRIFGDLEDFYLDKNDSANANIIAKARQHFENLSEQVINSYAEAQDSHSPSKEFEKLENDAVDGIVAGANNNEDRLKNVGKQMAENVKDGFKEGMSEIGDTLSSDEDKKPVLSSDKSSVLSSPTQEFDNEMQQNLVYLENYKNTISEIDALKLQPETDETKKKLEELNKLADYFVSRITVIRDENNVMVSPEMMVFGYNWNERLKKYPDDKRKELQQIVRDKYGLPKDSYTEFSGISEEISKIESKSESLRQSLTKTMQESVQFAKSIKSSFLNLADAQAGLREPYNNESDIKAYNKDIDKALEKFPQLIQFKDRFTSWEDANAFVKTDEWNDFLATLPQAKAYLESIGYEFKEIAQTQPNQTPLSSPNLTDTSISETKEEVKELNQEVDNIGNNFKEEESQVSSSVSNEISMLQNLDQKLGEVTTAVDTKTRAFQEEEQVVIGTVQREISSLETLEGQIWSIINEIKRLDDIKIQINIDGSQIDDSFVTLLDSIKTKADGLPVEALSNLTTALQGLKVTSKTAENLEMVAIALSEFKDSLSGIAPEGNEFLKLIGDITSRTGALKDLAEVLKSTTKKIQEAGNVTKDSSAGSSSKDVSSESKANEEIAASIRRKKEELASYELQVEELRYEIEKLQNVESDEKFGFDRAFNNKQAEHMRDKLVSNIFGADTQPWRMFGDVNNLDDHVLGSYQRYKEELQKIGYQLGEIRQIGHDQLEADIIPIPDKAITNAEECRRLLSEVTSMPNDKIVALNAQVTELENRISSVNAEIKELESTSLQEDTSKNDKKKNKNYDAKKNQAAIEETKASMERLKHLSDSKIFSDAFEKAAKEIEEENLKLKTTNGYLTEYKKKVKEIQTELQKQAGVIKFVDPGDLENARAVIGAYAREISEYQAKLTSDLPTSNKKQQNITYQWIEKETGMVRTLTLTYDKLTGAIYETSKAHTKAEKSGFKFSEMLKQGWMNVIRYIASFVSFYEVWNVIKQGFATIKELDTALTEMRKVSDESVQSLKNFQKVSFDLADTVGTTAKQIQNSTADFMRLGESLKEATESAKVANILLNVSEFGDIDSATESLIAMSAAYSELEKQDIVDKLNEVGKILAQTYSNVWRYKNLSR